MSRSYSEGDLKNLIDRLTFDLLQIRDGDVGMVPSVLCSYILDPNGQVDGFFTVCTQYEARTKEPSVPVMCSVTASGNRTSEWQ